MFKVVARVQISCNNAGLINEIAEDAYRLAIATLSIYSAESVVIYAPSRFFESRCGFSHNTTLSRSSPVPADGISTWVGCVVFFTEEVNGSAIMFEL